MREEYTAKQIKLNNERKHGTDHGVSYPFPRLLNVCEGKAGRRPAMGEGVILVFLVLQSKVMLKSRYLVGCIHIQDLRIHLHTR
jgi:hypothetical protein